MSDFPRPSRPLDIAIGRGGPTFRAIVDPELGDVRIGDLEGRRSRRIETGSAAHGRTDPFPGGESLDDAARRYAAAYERLLGRE